MGSEARMQNSKLQECSNEYLLKRHHKLTRTIAAAVAGIGSGIAVMVFSTPSPFMPVKAALFTAGCLLTVKKAFKCLKEMKIIEAELHERGEHPRIRVRDLVGGVLIGGLTFGVCHVVGDAFVDGVANILHRPCSDILADALLHQGALRFALAAGYPVHDAVKHVVDLEVDLIKEGLGVGKSLAKRVVKKGRGVGKSLAKRVVKEGREIIH